MSGATSSVRRPAVRKGGTAAPSTSFPGLPTVAAIAAMDRPALLALWTTILGGTAPRSMSQPVLRRVLAWEVQARAQGGLPAALRRRLDALAEADGKREGGAKAQARSPRMRPGGRFLREWAGVTHVIDVVEGGFVWRGTRYRSLSAIAQVITGAHWSGPRFFGLQAPAGAPGAKAERVPGAAARGAPSTRPEAARGATSGSLTEPAPVAPRRRVAPRARRAA